MRSHVRQKNCLFVETHLLPFSEGRPNLTLGGGGGGGGGVL